MATGPRQPKVPVDLGRDIVGGGASAGGIQALLALVEGLPADFPAPIFVVVHVTPHELRVLRDLLESMPAPSADDYVLAVEAPAGDA
jgi:chemotaxis response regulator CheB